jgi:hypothetical protein
MRRIFPYSHGPARLPHGPAPEKVTIRYSVPGGWQ